MVIGGLTAKFLVIPLHVVSELRLASVLFTLVNRLQGDRESKPGFRRAVVHIQPLGPRQSSRRILTALNARKISPKGLRDSRAHVSGEHDGVSKFALQRFSLARFLVAGGVEIYIRLREHGFEDPRAARFRGMCRPLGLFLRAQAATAFAIRFQ